MRMRFEEAPRLFVLVLSAELIDNAPLALEETYEQSRAWRASEHAAPGDLDAGDSGTIGINAIHDQVTITAEASGRPARPHRSEQRYPRARPLRQKLLEPNRRCNQGRRHQVKD